MLEIKNLSYRVQGEDGPVDILKNVSLNIEDKKFIVRTVRKGIWKYLFSKYKAKSKMFGLLIAVSPPLARKVFAK